MDKTFAYCLIALLVLCASLITYVTHGDKMNRACMTLTYTYIAILWVCVISLAVLTIIYKGT